MTIDMGYFFWYSKTSKEYRNFLPNTRRVILRCDVKLMEGMLINLSVGSLREV